MNLKTLGLDRETIEQIMAREKFDIEKEKRKLKETEDVLEELKTELLPGKGGRESEGGAGNLFGYPEIGS